MCTLSSGLLQTPHVQTVCVELFIVQKVVILVFVPCYAPSLVLCFILKYLSAQFNPLFSVKASFFVLPVLIWQPYFPSVSVCFTSCIL